MQPTVTLTQDQIRFFHDNGFLRIDAITTPDEIHEIREIYDRLFRDRVGHEEGNHFDLAGPDDEKTTLSLPQILAPSRYEPLLAETLYRANALAIARQLLGEEAIFQGDHAILKPPRFGPPTPWHQDEAYWDPRLDYNALSVWMPLQKATEASGCMYFIPASHKLRVLPHHTIGNDPRVHGLEVDTVDDSNAVPCPLPAGGATFHTSRTLHYASPNRTDEPRRAYILGFGTPPRPCAEAREFPWNDRKKTARQQRADQFATKTAAKV